MDKERVLDLLGSSFQGKYVSGAAEWLKNAYDHAVRSEEPEEPIIVFRIFTPKGRRNKNWVMECIDFLGTTFEEIDDHLKQWGSEVAASRGDMNWAGFGGHGNGGKFHMRENFLSSEFITYRDGRLTVFGFDNDKQYGFDDRFRGTSVEPGQALKIAGLDPEAMDIPPSIRTRLQSGDPDLCRFTVVRGTGFRHARQWHKRETFDTQLLSDAQAKQVVERANVIFRDDSRCIDRLELPAIPPREGFEGGRRYDLPAELPFEDSTLRLSETDPAGELRLRVAAEPFKRRDTSHSIDIRGRHNLIIANYRVSELPIRNRAGADFIYGELAAPVLEDLGLKQNDRVRLVSNDLSDAILEWIVTRIDDLSNELMEEENARRRAQDTRKTQELSNRLNRWKNRFLRAREVLVNVGPNPGPGEGGSDGGGSGGPGPVHTGAEGGVDGGGTGGSGAGGSGPQEGGGGSGGKTRKAPRFPEIRVSGFDSDPETGETFSLHPRQPVVYQRPHDVEKNLWWINAQRSLPERIITEDGADSARWRDYVFARFIEVIQAYDVRANWDGTSDVSEYLWELLGDIQDSAATDLADVLFAE